MSTQLHNFAQECVINYAKYNSIEKHYSIAIEDLPDFVRHEFAALIMADDESWATEAIGPDNSAWQTKMLPSFINYLKNSTDADQSIEFNAIWKNCVTDYMNTRIQQLLDDSISNIF